MAQLDDQAAVVADDSIDSAATDTNTPAAQEPQEAPQSDPLADLYPDEAAADDGPQEPAEGEDEGDEGEEGEEADETPPLDAPHSWKAEDKEIFAKLPRDAQEIIQRRESERDRFVQTKAQEAQQAKQQAEVQAREQLAEIRSQTAQQIEALAAQFMPQEPDPRLLYTGNPQDAVAYQQQQVAYQQTFAQQQSMLQRAQAERQEAERLAQVNEQGQIVEELRGLQGELPDWFEEGALKLKPEILSKLQPIGEALGYPPELLAQARGHDLKALNVAAGWKAKAEKWDDLQKRKMAGVREAKKLPPIAKPGAATGSKTPSNDPLKLLYPND